jgi:uncharacterized membrane protein
MHLVALKETATRLIEFVGVLLILVGAAAATVRFLTRWVSTDFDSAYREYRQHLGRAILIGLEFLVAGDIINTVAVDPTFQSVGILAGIVAIRTFLSFSLGVEIEGRWPWNRWQIGSAQGGPQQAR